MGRLIGDGITIQSTLDMEFLSADSDSRTDAEVVAATLHDREQFGVLIERYEAKLRRYIARLGIGTRDDQADVLQETFIKAYRNLNSFDTTLSFSSWIYRITHNEAMTWWRRRKARPEGSQVADGDEVLSLLHSTEASPEVMFDAESDVAEVGAALAKLDPKYRQVLTLRFFEHKEYEEISDILEIPIGSVGTLIHRGKKQLASVLNSRFERINKYPAT
jgi:RNA polymerase sigma-70 factor (ECF subfamily)